MGQIGGSLYTNAGGVGGTVPNATMNIQSSALPGYNQAQAATAAAYGTKGMNAPPKPANMNVIYPTSTNQTTAPVGAAPAPQPTQATPPLYAGYTNPGRDMSGEEAFRDAYLKSLKPNIHFTFNSENQGKFGAPPTGGASQLLK